MVGDKIQCIKGTRLIHVESMIKLGGGISVVCVILNIGLSSTNNVEPHTTEKDSPRKQSTNNLTSHITHKLNSTTSTRSFISTSSKLPQSSASYLVSTLTSTSVSTSYSTSIPTSFSTTPVSSKSNSSPISTSPKLSNAPMSSQTSLSTSTMRSPTSNDFTSSTMPYISYSDESSTMSSANKTSTQNPGLGGFHINTDLVVEIVFIVLCLVIAGSFMTFLLKKKGYISCQRCRSCLHERRRRRSSTSSRGPLTQDDATFVNISDPPRQERELFSIGDQDGGQDGRQRSLQRRGTEDDYFYDEIFGQSAFVDETTNRANTYLSVADDDDDDILSGLNVPDLVFKTPKKM
ncbi:uncharacterized protein LOC132736039 [Ruditapes philippinarum]|uniref:uncharacterized protein LOC132736039 n=1 Tax=Ruditapes philippinarum TaxID=129788 RepID=UPI00295BABA4|nr:uncharacterized protein LOC132736039 [Ruditapes philippinarum]